VKAEGEITHIRVFNLNIHGRFVVVKGRAGKKTE